MSFLPAEPATSGADGLQQRRQNELRDTARALLATGGRAPGSLAEAQAAAEVNGRLRRAGLQVVAEPFHSPSARGRYATALALVGAALGLLYPLLPAIAAGALALLLAVAALQHAAPARRPLESQNVIGTRAAHAQRRWRLVLLTPLDSPPQLSPLLRALGGRGWLVAPGRLVLLVALATLAGLGLALGGLWRLAPLLPTVALLPMGVAALLARHAPASPGALSYAASAAVALAAAEQLRDLRQVEVWVVALGATTAGDEGLHDFFARYPFEPDQTLLLGLEGMGAGRLACITREGALGRARADALLLRLAAAADAADPSIDFEPRPYRSAPTLLTAALRRWRGLTLATLDGQGRVPLRGSADDTPDAIDEQLLARALRLVVGIARQLDEQDKPNG